MHEKTTLSNGVRVISAEMPHVRSVSAALFFGVGSRFESPEEAGMSHFIEHMLFKGSERYSTAQRISEAIEGIGGVFNGGTGKELTGYTAKVSSDHFVDALDVLVNMVRHPLFDPQELEKERRVTHHVNEYIQRVDKMVAADFGSIAGEFFAGSAVEDAANAFDGFRDGLDRKST